MEAETLQLALGGLAAIGVVIGMQFKMNRCIGRQEGEIKGLSTMLITHLNTKK